MPIQGTTLVRAFATLTADADADIIEAENVVIGGVTYTFDAASPLDTINTVPFVTAFAPNMAALVKVINVTGTVLTDYYTGQTKNQYCHAVLVSAGVVAIYSRVAGVSGNLVAITVGNSAIVLSDNNGALLKLGAGFIDTAIDNLQASAQINSEVAQFLAEMEINPNL
ncbi:hypothetical protein LCGC14_1869930 [marine sediment metagenome]|uniref:Uncharacterized protein n=1 Tax=marine sediment metagenome TaxID=412755 RepID=A0A0F9GTE6_9ZZZZ